MDRINQICEDQRVEVLKLNNHFSLDKRKEHLTKLKNSINLHREEIEKALFKDLRKSKFESTISEIDFVVNGIDFALKNLKKWMKPKKVHSPLVHFPSQSFIYSEPLGQILIIGPWNYPFNLAMAPLIGAIAAGNRVVIKPSEVSEEVAKVIEKIISSVFKSNHVAVILGGVEETTALLNCRFDHIFYTGNGNVAKIIMSKASNNLTPVTLELGGKSPCIVWDVEKYEIAARRIAWGKWFNVGQTCVAPDYILIEKGKSEAFLSCLKREIENFYGDNPQKSEDYGRIINSRHFDRLSKMIIDEDVLLGGKVDLDDLYISPTVLKANFSSPSMKEEIFGPILPIIEIETLEEGINYIKTNEKPLALYVFSQNEDVNKNVTSELSYGGGCINDCIIHLSSENLPFGGVGGSGMGSYHGYKSFEVFSHQKSIMKRAWWLDLVMRYPPYKGKLKIIQLLMKWFG